jgi:hypothetical protein
MGVATSHWLTGFWPTQAKVKGIVPSAAWQWGRDSSVNDPLEESGHTPLYVGLLSVWGSIDGDLIFFPIGRRAPLWGLQQTYEGNSISKLQIQVATHVF